MRIKRIGLLAITAALMLGVPQFTASTAKAETHFSVGIGVAPGYGYYAPPPVVYRPACPGPGYYWTDGYYDPYGTWVAGFWAPPAYDGPRYFYGRPYYGGYRGRYYRGEYRRFDHREFRGRGNAYGWRR